MTSSTNLILPALLRRCLAIPRVASTVSVHPTRGITLIGVKALSLAPAAVYLITDPIDLLAFWPINILS